MDFDIIIRILDVNSFFQQTISFNHKLHIELEAINVAVIAFSEIHKTRNDENLI